MDLLDIANTLRTLEKSDVGDTYARELGFVHLHLTIQQWEDVKRLIAMFDLAHLVNIKQAQDSYPRLLNAVKLVLAIADHPEQNPTEKISLAPKTRAQLDSAVKFAEKS